MNAPASIQRRPAKLLLRAEDFELLEAGGAFAAYNKAELIDGEIYVMNAQFARHGLAKVRLLVSLANWLDAAGSALTVFSEVSLRLADNTMPEPDIFLAPEQAYGPVAAGAVALVIEVSDTTLDTDLGRKAQLYAAAGIPEYWVVDLEANRVLGHDRPGPDGYHTRREVPLGQPLHAATIEGLTVGTGNLIG